MMKLKKSLIMLSVILMLMSCGTPEAAEAITPATTTTAIFEKLTVIEDTTIAPSETTAAATTTYPTEEIYAVEFPIEFSDNYTINNIINPLSDEDYLTQVSPEAEKFYADYLAFATEQIEAEKPDYPEYPPYYEDGKFHHYPAGYTTYGLVDINSDGVPEIFKFFAYSDPTSAKVYFYDLYTKALLTDEDIYGFNPREGATYFGKNEDGILLFCTGYQHSNYEGYFKIAELLFDKDTENLTCRESFRVDFILINNVFYCSGYSVNGVQYGENHDITAADFEAAYRKFYDAIDFDVYWICGDILYHGAEETEYKGKMAYEKYLEFTRNQALLKHITDNQKIIDKLMIDDINNDGIVELVYVKPDLKILTYYSDGEIKTLESLTNVGGNCACGSAPLYYNKNTDEIMIRRTYFDYRDICFYEYIDGDYNLTKQYQWGGFTIPLAIDEWYESAALDSLLQEENLTFEDLKKLDEAKLHEYAYRLDYTWKMDQYMFEDEIITKADWDNAINEFKSADGCISLCPYNTDLDFVDIRSEDFSDYVENKLFNS